MSFAIQGKTAVVTGAANGVGLAIARHFVDRGANVMFADMDEEKLIQEAAGEDGEERDGVAYFAGDLREKFGLEGGKSAQERLEALKARLDGESISAVIEGGLHEYLDALQLELIEIGGELGRDFFGWAPVEHAQGQAQGKG